VEAEMGLSPDNQNKQNKQNESSETVEAFEQVMKELLLDTHVVVWMYTGDAQQLSATAIRAIETNDLFVSPAVRLELGYLHELNRVTAPPNVVLADLAQRIGLQVRDLSFDRVVEDALAIRFTRDPFDRLIVAHANALGFHLLSKDRIIRKHYARCVW
jgi:PIN domain nuclease of toxin-antitoxin system